ncbi:MAG: hypothetical protein QF521_14840 [Alphaproteobacteria bacterium]|jgi:hypothetical protein|nr:hypothetical protein [Alphaproteobacteria bacterium]
MTYMPISPLEAADRVSPRQSDERMPYYIAVPIWISLAVVAWSPLIVIARSVMS